MSCVLINNASVVKLYQVARQQTVTLADGRIQSVSLTDAVSARGADRVVDVGGNYLAPGFIDLHIHGLHGFRLDNGPDDLQAICALLPRYGVKGFVPTLTAPVLSPTVT